MMQTHAAPLQASAGPHHVRHARPMRNVIVNGGSRGLGLGIVRTLQAAGYNVIAITRRNTQDLSRLARERASGPSGVVHCKSFALCDVRGIPRLVKSLR